MDARVGSKNDPIQKVRGIVIHPDGLLLMRRVRKDLNTGQIIEYYVFPGGGREIGETIDQCLIREVKEEAGVRVRVGKEFARQRFEVKEEYFLFCDYIDGVVGSGEGPEFTEERIRERGLYIAEVVPFKKVLEIDLKPYSIRKKLIPYLTENFINKK